MRGLLERCREWGAITLISKLGIKKAYETVSRAAISRMFEDRQVLHWLRGAYWRLYLDRQLCFRPADWTVAFETFALRRMPQGSPSVAILAQAVSVQGCLWFAGVRAITAIMAF